MYKIKSILIIWGYHHNNIPISEEKQPQRLHVVAVVVCCVVATTRILLCRSDYSERQSKIGVVVIARITTHI